jgi:hypothetical protein
MARFSKFGQAGVAPVGRTELRGEGRAPLGTFIKGRKQYGLFAGPVVQGRAEGLAWTPALTGLFRAGRTVGVSQINAMATNILRG